MFEKLEVSTRVELVFTALGHPAARSYPITPEEPSDFLGDSALFEWYSRAAEHLFPFAQLQVEGSETRVFDLPVSLFDHRHFYRSEHFYRSQLR
jgi:hypothetical protein